MLLSREELSVLADKGKSIRVTFNRNVKMDSIESLVSSIRGINAGDFNNRTLSEGISLGKDGGVYCVAFEKYKSIEFKLNSRGKGNSLYPDGILCYTRLFRKYVKYEWQGVCLDIDIVKELNNNSIDSIEVV